MTPEAFEALVHKLEQQASQQPECYRRKAIGLAILGNLYVSVIVGGLLLLFALLIFLLPVLKVIGAKLALGLGVFIYFVFKAMWVKLSPPVGYEIKRQQAPELFAMIDDLQRQLNCVPFHHVLLDEEFNAGVLQIPRFGLLGGTRNYLVIGVPLMKLLTREQFKSVLAHEFGHLSRGHNRVSNWIYRQRLRWAKLVAALEQNESFGTFLFKPFLNWFHPYFAAYTFPLARANEYQADATAAQLTSAKVAAQALTSVNVVSSYLHEKYWPAIFKQADNLPQPSFTPFVAMSHREVCQLEPDTIRAWVLQAMEQTTDIADTHPSLNDRLNALKQTPQLVLPQEGESADHLLGENRSIILQSFDQQWQQNISASWQRRYLSVQQDKQTLAQLEAKNAAGQTLDIEEAWQRARLTETIANDAEAALAQLQDLYQRAPNHAATCYSLGMSYLERDDGQGCDLLEQAMQLDDSFYISACQQIRNFYWQQGQQALAHQWHQRLVEREELQQQADRERSRLMANDKLLAHGLPADMIERLKQQLQQIEGLRKVYLVQKQVKILSHRPCYILAFRVCAMWQPYSEKRALAALELLSELDLPEDTFILNIDADATGLESQMKKLAGRIL